MAATTVPADLPSVDPRTAAAAGARRAVWGLVIGGVLLRAWVIAAGWFSGDDYVLQGFAWRSPFDAAYLGATPTGSFAPGALALQWPLTHAWPMDRAPLALVLVVGQALVVIAFALLALELWGARRLTLVPVAMIAVSPLLLPAAATWSQALSLVPYQLGLTLLLLGVVRWTRTGGRGLLAVGAVVWAASLAFDPTGVVVPLLALGLVPALSPGRPGIQSVGRAVRRAWIIWVPTFVVAAAYAVLVVRVAGWPARVVPEASQAADVLARTATTALAPAALGGPIDWTPAGAGAALAAPPTWLVLVSVEAMLALVVWSCARSRAARRAWLWAAAAVLLAALLAVTGPLSVASAALVQTLLLTSAAAVPLAVAAGVGLVAVAPAALPLLARAGRPDPAAALRTASTLGVVLLVVMSALSTARYREVVRDNSTRAYVAAATASLAAAADGPTLVDQAVPASMVSPLRFPYNQASWVLSPVSPRPEYADPTTLLRVLDDTGTLRPALVEGVGAQPGPVAGCGWIVRGTADIWLAAPVVDFSHLVRIGYLSTGDGTATLAFADRPAQTFRVTRGLGEVVTRLPGGGGVLRIADLTPGVTLCTDDVRVGEPKVVPQ